MTRTAGAGMLALFALAGCSAREVCSRDVEPASVESTRFTGDRVLVSAGEREELDVELELVGLPELWAPEGAIIAGRLSVLLTFAYEGIPADGSVEMPSIGVSFRQADGSGASGPYPDASGLRVDGHTFPTCVSAEDRACCEFGARACTIHDTVTVERLDGAPFPPLEVAWELRASASIDDCPLGGAEPELDLRVTPP